MALLSLLLSAAAVHAQVTAPTIESNADGGIVVTVDSNDGFWVKTVGEGGDSNPEMLATKGYVNAILKTQGSQTTFAINKLEQDASSKIDSNGDDIATLKEQLARANAEIASMKGDLQSAVQTIADFMAEADDDDGICTAKVTEINNGVVHGHGSVLGSIRVIECKEGYIMRGPSTVVCNSDGNWSPIPECQATTTTTTTTTVTTTTEDPNGGWTLLLRQKKCGMNYNEALESNLDNVNADCYSDLRNIDNYKHDNKWTFKLTYPSVRLDDGTAPRLIWSQTSDPTTVVDSVDGYVPIDVKYATSSDDGGAWTCTEGPGPWENVAGGIGGLMRSSRNERGTSLMDSEIEGRWHIAVGGYSFRNGRPDLPGPCGVPWPSSNALWVCKQDSCDGI